MKPDRLICRCVTLWIYLLCVSGWCIGVEIRRLSVPRWVRNGTEEWVVLDCEYAYTENDLRLVVKWFHGEGTEPVYQWIPELDRRHTSGVLRGRLDMEFEVRAADAYSRFRALKIRRPSTELGGKYTCLVTSLAGQDSRGQVMTVFVPAHDFKLSYTETAYHTVNVSCDVKGVFPLPILRLFIRPSSESAPLPVGGVKTNITVLPTGAYDAVSHRTFKISELSADGATVFECLLELPGTNYLQSKRIVYFPGLEGPRIGAPHGLSSASGALPTPLDIVLTFLSLLHVTACNGDT